MSDDAALPEPVRALVREFNPNRYIRFLEALTGIPICFPIRICSAAACIW